MAEKTGEETEVVKDSLLCEEGTSPEAVVEEEDEGASVSRCNSSVRGEACCLSQSSGRITVLASPVVAGSALLELNVLFDDSSDSQLVPGDNGLMALATRRHN